jgi:hypothetical protein
MLLDAYISVIQIRLRADPVTTFTDPDPDPTQQFTSTGH